ncbi:MAG: hypothetical protein CMM58_07485 [Rhodospirillaceae bacterium]|nr:hypothetical protein [Rhodospirillaceae bacterium]
MGSTVERGWLEIAKVWLALAVMWFANYLLQCFWYKCGTALEPKMLFNCSLSQYNRIPETKSLAAHQLIWNETPSGNLKV